MSAEEFENIEELNEEETEVIETLPESDSGDLEEIESSPEESESDSGDLENFESSPEESATDTVAITEQIDIMIQYQRMSNHLSMSLLLFMFGFCIYKFLSRFF